MTWIKPDQVEDILNQEAVDSTVLVLAQGELPSVLVVFLPTFESEAVLDDSLFAEVNPVKSRRSWPWLGSNY